jgi:putative ABC transport system substrate-binding protein
MTANWLEVMRDNLPVHQRGRGPLAARILGGTEPADIPVEQPTRVELILNMKTAKAPDIKIPQSIPLLADRIIV